MLCVRRLGESTKKAKDAPSKLPMHVNSVVFLCVAKCGVKGLALLSGTAKLCRRDRTFSLYIFSILITMQSPREND